RVQFGAEEFAEQPFDSRPFRRIKSEKPFDALAITFVVIVMSLDELCAYGRLSRLRLASFCNGACAECDHDRSEHSEQGDSRRAVTIDDMHSHRNLPL